MTAGELIQVLSQYDEDTPIYFSHDNGYTYGSLREENIDFRCDEEDENYDEEDENYEEE